MKKNNVFFSGVLGALALITLFSSLSSGQGPLPNGASAQPVAMSEAVEPLPDVFIGSENAPVTVIEYASFTCVHCGNFANEVFPQIKEEFVDTGKVKFALREAYTDKFGLWAGLLAYEASDGRKNADAYYDFVDALYETQHDWAFGSTNETEIADKLRQVAAKHGVSAEDAEAVLNDESVVKSIAETFTFHAQRDNIQATPTFIINGQPYPNMPLDDFRNLLNDAVKTKE